MKWKSKAQWKPSVYKYNGCVSEDTHDTKSQAESVCRLLEKNGFGGNGVHFPLKTWVEPVEEVAVETRMTMTKTSKYRVNAFWDINQNNVPKSKATAMMVTCIGGSMKGITVPEGMGLAKALKLNIGDVYTETVTQTKD